MLLEEADKPSSKEEDNTPVVDTKVCKNPRCITTIEQELPHLFKLTDADAGVYRCIYCESKAED
jgi:aspartate carbamoyltransferase regulatory subunit